MDWKLMDDPANVENRNAGNGGDLVKHTVYLATLSLMRRRKPWSQGLLLKECHAGRGIYRIPSGDARCQLLSCLYSDPIAGHVLLQNAQRSILRTLGCWPSGREAVQWYAGSALINAATLAEDLHSPNRMELYEYQPDTREILRSALKSALSDEAISLTVFPEEDQGLEFDGEAYVEREIDRWGHQSLLLLDPFAMWRQECDRRKRSRYGAIFDTLIRRGNDAPSLILFWTWGRAFLVADADLDGTATPVKNGYAELRSKLHRAGFRFVLVKWRWGLQFAMWVVAPLDHLTALRDDIDTHCQLLSSHLTMPECSHRLSHPRVEVTID
jgi:hypothetical protein